MKESNKLVVVEDDDELREAVAIYLGKEGFDVATARSAAELAGIFSPDTTLVLLDVNLPDDNGFELARALRRRSDVGIIMITGRTDLVDTVVGLEIGADDYIAKPFKLRELLARIRAVLRRRSPAQEDRGGSLEFDRFTLDPARRQLWGPNGEVVLTSKEFSILQLLASHPGRTVSREDIIERAIGGIWSAEGRAVDMHIGHLRKKLEADPKNPQLIKTVHGTGYTLAAPKTAQADAVRSPTPGRGAGPVPGGETAY